MISIAEPVAYDVTEVASEVARVMFNDGLSLAMATMDVIARKGLPYGQSELIAKKAQQAITANQKVRGRIEERRGRRLRLCHFTHASATAAALG